jgi:hypothetical protein
VKPQWVRCKLDETMEQSCSYFLAYTSVSGPPWTGAVRGPPHRGLGPRNFPLKIKSVNQLFREFCKEALYFFEIDPQYIVSQRGPQN